MTARFTVVIPTYNRALMIRKAIKSVLNQGYSHWNLLIIDDASTDNTMEVISSYLLHPNIRYHRMDVNSGISKVLNEALSMVDTPYLVQLDSDDWLPRNALRILSRAIKKDREKSALYYGDVKLWRTDGKRYREAYTIEHRQFRSKYDFLTYTSWMVAPRCYRVSSLNEVGGWDTSDPYDGRIMEDRRIILKLIERYRTKWIDKILYNRSKHKKQLTSPSSKRKRNFLRRQTFNMYLKRWGNKYRAVYGYKNGYLIIRRLKKRR